MKRSEDATLLLVTGANGFLGSEIVRVCLQQDRKIRGTGRSQADQPLLDYVQVDIAGDGVPDTIFDGVETVIHTAGLAHQFGKNAADSSAFFDVNARGAGTLATAAAVAGVKHFVLISSSGVYGSDQTLSKEDHACHPIGPYAQSKLEGERLVTAACEDSGMRLTILRMTTLYGEGDRGNVSRLMQAIDRGRFVNIGDGRNKKSLLHKTDAALACLLAADASETESPAIYNVASSPVEMSRVVDALQKSLGAKRPLTIPSWMALGTSRLLSVATFGRGPFARIHTTLQKWIRSDTFDGSKFQTDLGFEARVPIQQGIAAQVKHYRLIKGQCFRPSKSKRIFDLVLGFLLVALFGIPMLLIAFLVKATSKGPVLYWSNRVGENGKTFQMAKFRSMRTDTPEVATHLLQDSKSYITGIGKVLRKTSLDELPQLLNILIGDMSFVGPRPALPSQTEVNESRDYFGVSALKPGITGWAAINGRDELRCSEKVEFDTQYLRRQSLGFDLQIIFRTALAVAKRDGVKQADDDGLEPFVRLRDGKTTAVIASSDVVAATSAYLQKQGNSECRFVSLRLEATPNREHLALAIASASEVVLITQNDSSPNTAIYAELLRDLCGQTRTFRHVDLPRDDKHDSLADRIPAQIDALASSWNKTGMQPEPVAS